MLSICEKCLVEDKLIEYVRNNGMILNHCETCGAVNVYAIDLYNDVVFMQAVRSLTRLNYNEWDYNTHWGGVNPSQLIWNDRPFFSNNFYKNDDTADEIIEFIFYEAYYEPEKGVSLFYGYGPDGLPAGFYWSIKNSHNGRLSKLKASISTKNYLTALSIIQEVVENAIANLTVEVTDLFLHRARIGFAEQGYDGLIGSR
ncbi:hypothetical protein [Sphingobacterium sp. xlx-96]|uniref:hypothetical protein n=2 Tax=Sphingobacterium TaxID=28453 RepID=UPI0013DC7562|nr:hypothetical protein [Sphingobacterium sp. xlx-96]